MTNMNMYIGEDLQDEILQYNNSLRLLNEVEILTQLEAEIVMEWHPEEARRYLNNLGDKYLNTNVYLELNDMEL